MPSAVAVKVAVEFPDVTTTEAGTVSAEVTLLERVTVAPLADTGRERVTVQGVVLEAAKVVFPHDIELRVMGRAVTVKVTG